MPQNLTQVKETEEEAIFERFTTSKKRLETKSMCSYMRQENRDSLAEKTVLQQKILVKKDLVVLRKSTEEMENQNMQSMELKIILDVVKSGLHFVEN